MAGGLIFTKDVKDMKAWELYIGSSVFYFFVGIAFYLVKMLIDMTFLKKSKTFNSAYSVVENISTGQATSADGKKFAQQLFPGTGSSGSAPVPYGMSM